MEYTKTKRALLVLPLIVLFIVGIVMNPMAFLATLAIIPPAFSAAVAWEIVTLALTWVTVDLFMKFVLGKSLREWLQDKDPRFEQQIAVALVIATPIIMLVSSR